MRAYDIRGIVGETLNTEDAYALGYKFSCFVKKTNIPRVVVGYDGRLSSTLLNSELIRGLVDAGSSVTSIGLCPSPMLYYADKVLSADGAIMITGSHNPSNYNGFKMLVRGKAFMVIAFLNWQNYNKKGIANKGRVKNFNIYESYLIEITKDIENLIKI